MGEDEPRMRLTKYDDTEFYATRDNTSLFTFLGRTALDHIFVNTEVDEENEKVMIGTYIFRCHRMFEPMEDYMVVNDYPLHLNLPEVADCDEEAFNRMVHQQATDIDTIPADWL